MSSRRRLGSCLAAAALAFAIGGRATAQPNGAAVATELFNAGRDLMKSGNYEAACPKLAESARLDAKVGTLARLAECEEKLGHLASARARWQQAVNVARSQRDDRLQHVQQEFARLDAVVPKLSLFATANVSGLAVTVDELPIGVGAFGQAFPIDPGRHTITATARGKKAWSHVVETKADGAVISVAIPTLEDDASDAARAASSASAPPVTANPAPADHDRGPSPFRAFGLVTVGVGIVSIGVGTAFAIDAKAKLDASNAQPGGCIGNDCPADAADTRDAARTAGTLATVFLVAGGGLAAAGVATLLFAPKTKTTTAMRILPSAGPGNGTIVARGVW